MMNRGSNKGGKGESRRRRVDKMRWKEARGEKDRRMKKRKWVREHL